MAIPFSTYRVAEKLFNEDAVFNARTPFPLPRACLYPAKTASWQREGIL